MKDIFLFIILFCFFSCKTARSFTVITDGVFVYNYENSGEKEELILNNDGSFVFNSYGTKCKGNWKYLSRDSILIKCGEEPWTNVIGQGYLFPRERKIKVLNENKLKIPIFDDTKRKYIILERADSSARRRLCLRRAKSKRPRLHSEKE